MKEIEKIIERFEEKFPSVVELLFIGNEMTQNVIDKKPEIKDFLRTEISSLLSSYKSELEKRVEKMGYTFKKVDWGDGIITDEPVEDETKSLSYAGGYNQAVSDIKTLIKTLRGGERYMNNEELKPFTKVLIGEGNKLEKDLCGGTVNNQWIEEVDDINFDGHRVLWGFSYEPYTYLKESELSGKEWRKGGWVRFFRNGVRVYEDFCREPDNAVFRIASLLHRLQDLDWQSIKEGKKLYWKDTPCVIKSIILEQGSMILRVDGSERFPDMPGATEDWEKLEDPTEVKVDFLDPHIWWFRK